ncbi:hypothetical protein C8R44DRAFT_992128 [Mycena epipterygia]|nr:hypothetical protein C8R44DRAFT_992128 [Mycena epipterygia]
MGRHTQLPQELIDHTVDFLHDSPRAWPACALISRSWVYSAQSRIFRRISFVSGGRATIEHRWARFLQVARESPHLIYHVRHLDVSGIGTAEGVSMHTFLAICNFRFTHLTAASVWLSWAPPSYARGLQQLLSLPTLCRLTMGCNNTDPSAFFPIWDRCSSALRHLELSYYPIGATGFHLTQQSSSTIRLESLALRMKAPSGVREWLMHPHCPLDLSGLSALSIYTNTELLDSPKFVTALRTIKFFDLVPEYTKPAIDLSSCNKLEELRITVSRSSWPWLLTMLSHTQQRKISTYVEITA